MTITVGPPDLLRTVEALNRRIYDLEQGRGGITYDSNGAPVFKRGMTIGDQEPIYVDEPTPAPTGLTLSWGSFYENVFVSATWTAPTGPGADQVRSYECELTEVGQGVVQSQTVGGTSCRFNGVKPNTQYSVRVRSINRLSRFSAYTEPETITTGADATVPAQVQNVRAGAGQKTVTVWWDENSEEDVKNGHGGYECQLDTSSLFTTPARRTVRTTGTIVSFGDLVTDVTYYTRVRAFDSSGNFGPFSLTKTATPGKATGGDIGEGEVCDDHVCASGISAAHIKFGTMEGDRIQTNTLDANRIKTSSLDAQIITIAGTGMFRMGRTSSPFNYVIQDSAGIRFYKNGSSAFAGGTLVVDLNVTTGGASFTGNIDAQSGTISGNISIGGKIRALADGSHYVQLGTDIFSEIATPGWYGLTLSHANSNNFFARSNAGQIVFRVGNLSTGGPYLEWNSTGAALTIQGGHIRTGAEGARRLLIGALGAFAHQIAFYWSGSEVTPGRFYFDDISSYWHPASQGANVPQIIQSGDSGSGTSISLNADNVFAAGTLIASSDSGLKSQVATVPPAECLNRVLATPVRSYVRDDMTPGSRRTQHGFVAQEAPTPHRVKHRTLRLGATDPANIVEIEALDVIGMLSDAWGAIQELSRRMRP